MEHKACDEWQLPSPASTMASGLRWIEKKFLAIGFFKCLLVLRRHVLDADLLTLPRIGVARGLTRHGVGSELLGLQNWTDREIIIEADLRLSLGEVHLAGVASRLICSGRDRTPLGVRGGCHG